MLNDPYFDSHVCAERLLKEYRLHGRLIVAVDFDDTVFDFHGKDYGFPEVLDMLLRCQALGFHLVLFTGTHPDQYDAQKAYLKERGIHIDFVNQNPIPLPFGNHGKMYYNILLDDRAGLGQAYRTLILVLNQIAKETR